MRQREEADKRLERRLKDEIEQSFLEDRCWEGRARISRLLVKTSLFQQESVASRYFADGTAH